MANHRVIAIVTVLPPMENKYVIPIVVKGRREQGKYLYEDWGSCEISVSSSKHNVFHLLIKEEFGSIWWYKGGVYGGEFFSVRDIEHHIIEGSIRDVKEILSGIAVRKWEEYYGNLGVDVEIRRPIVSQKYRVKYTSIKPESKEKLKEEVEKAINHLVMKSKVDNLVYQQN